MALLGMTNFLGVTTLEKFFLSSPVIFFCPASSIKGACTGNTCFGATYVSSVGAVKHLEMHLQSFWILEVRSTGLKIQVGAAYIKSICVDNTSTVKHLGMHLQSFQILKVEDAGL